METQVTINNIDLSVPFKVHYGGFGDTWLRLGYLINACKAQNKTAEICWAAGKCGYCRRGSYESKNPAISASIDLLEDGHLLNHTLDTTGLEIEFPEFSDFWKNNFCVTKKRWKYNSRYVCLQLDGRSHPRKMLSKVNESKLINELKSRGYRVVNCGGERPVDQIVDALSDCAFFVGVGSGISLLSASVGTPTNVILNGLPARILFQHYKNKKIDYHIDLDGFLNEVSAPFKSYL